MTNLQEARQLIRFWNRLQKPGISYYSFTMDNLYSMPSTAMTHMSFGRHAKARAVLIRRARCLLKNTDYEVIWDE